MTIEIINGKLLNSAGEWTPVKSIRIANGHIVDLNKTRGDLDQTKTPFVAEQTIDASGCYLVPGLIDLNAALCEPGYQVKGTIASETAAAAAGGVTTLCCTPDTDPVNDSEAVTKLIEKLVQKSAKCRVLPMGALTQGLKGEHLAEYAALKKSGCVALSNGYHAVKNLAITKRCFEYAKTQNMSVFINPIDASLHVGSMHESLVSTTLGLHGISSLAETIPVAQLIKLAEQTGVHLHLSQLSAADSVTQVREAKAKGIKVTADVAVHNLVFTDQQVQNFNSLYHCQPPLRSEADRQALLEGVRTGVIDAITSAHRPHEAAAKKLPFAQTAPGISGIELLIPIAIQLHDSGELPLVDFIAAMTSRAAKIIALEEPQIDRTKPANLCIFNPAQRWSLTLESMHSKGKNSPFLDQQLKGKVIATLFEGTLSYQDVNSNVR